MDGKVIYLQDCQPLPKAWFGAVLRPIGGADGTPEINRVLA